MSLSYSLAGGGMAEAEENPPDKTARMRSKTVQFLIIVVLPTSRTSKSKMLKREDYEGSEFCRKPT